mmetsp:Transcript_2084/g.6438  ORF Transcript_2084/g.6438 Transcript_2084/m.6438 type:complete len:305 (+) Transcript_2084:2170-3084(+)
MVLLRLTRSVSVISVISSVFAEAALAATGGGTASSSSSSPSLSPLSLSSEDSPKISLFTLWYSLSVSSYFGSTVKTSRPDLASSLSSRLRSCVIWSSCSTRSSSSGTAGKSSKLVFLTAKSPSITNCTRLWMAPSCKIPLNPSKTECSPFGLTSSSVAPTSFTKPTASSTESSDGFSSRSARISRANSSCSTCWFTRWAINLQAAVQIGLSFLLYALRNWRINLETSRSPISGNLVLMTATRAAYTLEKAGLATWDFMTERTKSPLPLSRFSPMSSGKISFRFLLFTLFTRPFMLFLRASQASL